MSPEDAKARLAALLERVAALPPAPSPVAPTTLARPRLVVDRRDTTRHGGRTLEDQLLGKFTPAEVLRFLVERTVLPATEDGLALIAAYPELGAAAPELVEDMAVAYRSYAREDYPRYFARVAVHHGLQQGSGA